MVGALHGEYTAGTGKLHHRQGIPVGGVGPVRALDGVLPHPQPAVPLQQETVGGIDILLHDPDGQLPGKDEIELGQHLIIHPQIGVPLLVARQLEPHHARSVGVGIPGARSGAGEPAQSLVGQIQVVLGKEHFPGGREGLVPPGLSDGTEGVRKQQGRGAVDPRPGVGQKGEVALPVQHRQQGVRALVEEPILIHILAAHQRNAVRVLHRHAHVIGEGIHGGVLKQAAVAAGPGQMGELGPADVGYQIPGQFKDRIGHVEGVCGLDGRGAGYQPSGQQREGQGQGHQRGPPAFDPGEEVAQPLLDSPGPAPELGGEGSAGGDTSFLHRVCSFQSPVGESGLCPSQVRGTSTPQTPRRLDTTK